MENSRSEVRNRLFADLEDIREFMKFDRPETKSGDSVGCTIYIYTHINPVKK